MIKIEKTVVSGWEAAIRGMRNPMNSWELSDSVVCPNGSGYEYCVIDKEGCQRVGHGETFNEAVYCVGKNDLKLMKKLSAAGNDHAKYLRMINVTCDITAPLYWYKEFETYKVGTVANSCSTMHKIHAREFTLDDFSIEHLNEDVVDRPFRDIIDCLNFFRELYIKNNDKRDWWQMIQLLPSSYNQKRTVQLNYQVLKNMYHARKNHKLDCWHTFCHWIEQLPYSELITGETNDTEEK